jgi:hypothetical protein
MLSVGTPITVVVGRGVLIQAFVDKVDSVQFRWNEVGALSRSALLTADDEGTLWVRGWWNYDSDAVAALRAAAALMA